MRRDALVIRMVSLSLCSEVALLPELFGLIAATSNASGAGLGWAAQISERKTVTANTPRDRRMRGLLSLNTLQPVSGLLDFFRDESAKASNLNTKTTETAEHTEKTKHIKT